ncbi:MAG: BrnT family toxin [Magnetococcales bacterium]|nr:BrnT family toxin [Magnetococcales bacterium]
MKITYAPAKDLWNTETRQLPFDRAADFQWQDALIMEDLRRPYPERRFVAVGYLDQRLHVLCFTPAEGGIRVIRFRKANRRKARQYDNPITID